MSSPDTPQEQKRPSFMSSYIRGETTLGLWRLISRGLSGVSGLIILSNLDLFNYGTYILLFAFYMSISSPLFRLLSAPVFNDIVRFIGKGEEAHAKKLFFEIAVVRIVLVSIVALLVWFIGSGIVEHFYGKDVALLIKVVPLLLVSNVFNVLLASLFQARLYFGLLSLRPIILNGLKFVFLVSILLFSSFDIVAVLYAHVTASFLSIIALVPFSFGAYAPWRGLQTTSQSMLWPIVRAHGKWHMAGQFLSEAVSGVRPWLVKFFVNTEAVAIYSVAENLFGVLKLFFPTSTLTTLLPRHLNNRKNFQDIFLRGTKFLFVAGVCVAILGAIIIPFGVFLFIPQYVSSLKLFWVMLIAFPFVSTRSTSHMFLVALRKQKFLFFMSVISTGAGILFPAIFLQAFGLWGMAFERVTRSVFLSSLYLRYILYKEIAQPLRGTLYTFDASDAVLARTFTRAAYSHMLHLSRRAKTYGSHYILRGKV